MKRPIRDLTPEFKQCGVCRCVEERLTFGWSEKNQCTERCGAWDNIQELWVRIKNGPGILEPLSIEAEHGISEYLAERFKKKNNE